MRRSISIGIRLKVDNKLVSLIALTGTLNTLYHLLTNRGIVTRYRRGKRIDITISTAAVAFRAVAIGTSETAIDNHFEHALAFILFAQPSTVVVISLYPLL